MKDNINDYIDYKVGDWVETCAIMPGIVQDIIPSQNTVKIFYPNVKERNREYTGGSCCSITNCGVHKIDSELANAFLKVGEERATKVYEFLQRNFHIKGISKRIDWWKELRNEIKNRTQEEQIKAYRIFCNKRNYWSPNFDSYQEYHKHKIEDYNKTVEKYENELSVAWDNFDKLYHQTIMDLSKDVINIVTKGIWLSYQKHTLKRLKDGNRIIELIPTGEQFLVKKYRIKRVKTRYQFIKKLN